MARLTKREEDVCRFVEEHWDRFEMGPTYRHLADRLGYSKIGGARTLAQNAKAKGFLIDERHAQRSLQTTAAWEMWKARLLDRATNPMVTEAIESDPTRFEHFDEDELDFLYSQRGVGGALTREGVYQEAERLDEIRRVQGELAPLLFDNEVRREVEELIERVKERLTPRMWIHTPENEVHDEHHD